MVNMKLLGIVCTTTAVLCTSVTWGFTASYYRAKLAARDAAAEVNRQAALIAANTAKRDKELAIASAVAAADTKHYEELRNAKNEIDSLRAGISNGTIRLRQTKSSCGNDTHTTKSTSMDNKRRAEPATSEPTVEQDILQLGEYALTAVKQRDACVDILHKEREVLNESAN